MEKLRADMSTAGYHDDSRPDLLPYKYDKIYTENYLGAAAQFFYNCELPKKEQQFLGDLRVFHNYCPLMAQCPKNEYFDNLLLSCTPCHLRCSSAPPPSCENYCEKSTDSSGILWICLGLGVILILTLFTLMVLFKWKHLKQLKEKLENTDSSAEPNNILKDNAESSVNTEEIRHTIPSETLMYSVEECTCSDCGLVKPQTGCATSFPLPATEERATVLVTTKSFDCYNYVLGVG